MGDRDIQARAMEGLAQPRKPCLKEMAKWSREEDLQHIRSIIQGQRHVKRIRTREVEETMNAYTCLSCLHNLGHKVIKEKVKELITKHKQDATLAIVTPPFPVPQDPLEET